MKLLYNEKYQMLATQNVYNFRGPMYEIVTRAYIGMVIDEVWAIRANKIEVLNLKISFI